MSEAGDWRSIADMLAGRNAPEARPGAGRVLAELDDRQCRFPLRGDGAATRFCAEEIAPGEWRPGFSGGCYCRFHRHVTEGPGTRAERDAPRALERAA